MKSGEGVPMQGPVTVIWEKTGMRVVYFLTIDGERKMYTTKPSVHQIEFDEATVATWQNSPAQSED